jgi:protein-S-isoprenylcysteine O-methyltransferase Ste14
MAGAWWWFVARPTFSYLDPYLGGSIDQLVTMHKESGGGRVLLAASVQPLWERGLAALAPAVAGLVCLKAMLMMRRSWSGHGLDTMSLMAFGLVYFPSVLFLFAPSGAEGARRSWAFTYVGLALIGAFVVVRHAGDRRHGRSLPARWHRPVGLVLLSVMLIGGVAAGLNDPYRFPRPFRWGTDTTSASPEARTVAEQLRDRYGPVAIVTDQYTALQMVAYGDLEVASPAEGFPAWNLVQTRDDPDPDLIGELVGSHYDYLVVDMRMADRVPFNQTNFGEGDPLTGQPTPRANLDRLDHVPWASKIMATSNLRVYRLDLGLVGRPLATGGPGRHQAGVPAGRAVTGTRR